MNLNFRWDPNIPRVLKAGHEDIRADLVRASIEPGPIGAAAKRVAQLCLPHFEFEERAVFPVFGLLDDLIIGEVRPEMAEMLPLINAFDARLEEVESRHQAITNALTAFSHAARQERNREYAEFAHRLKAHENIEDQVVFPTVVLIGKYLRKSLGVQ